MRTTFSLLILFLLTAAPVFAHSGLDFTLHKLESGRPGPTMLVVGGIQGDEPGGFNAASLIVSNYTITKGSVWVVPNLNFPSIIKCSRGLYGDMNRKFAAIDASDPEYKTIEKIKRIILDEQVDLVLNLHDGSGFYRPQHISQWENPQRWGQSVIIDQDSINVPHYGALEDLAAKVVAEVNGHLYEPGHAYHVKNTRTREGDEEMAKTLTFFAINQGKPAFGVEASKNFPAHLRAYYHLNALESFMRAMGIGYKRNFELAADGVREAMDSNVAMSFFGNKIFLDLRNARAKLGYFPVKKTGGLDYVPGNPLMAVVGADKNLSVYYGNRNVTTLEPQYFDFDESLRGVTMRIDGRGQNVPFGRIVRVKDAFSVHPGPECRVNVIGFSRGDAVDEADVDIGRKDLLERFSVDKDGGVYRVEVYRDGKFAGMVLVDFLGEQAEQSLAGSDFAGVHAEALNSFMRESQPGADASR
mgnify:CR=1 FL=1